MNEKSILTTAAFILVLALPRTVNAEVSVIGQIMPNGAAAVQACNPSYGDPTSVIPVACDIEVFGYYFNGIFAYSKQRRTLMADQCEWVAIEPGLVPFVNSVGRSSCWPLPGNYEVPAYPPNPYYPQYPFSGYPGSHAF